MVETRRGKRRLRGGRVLLLLIIAGMLYLAALPLRIYLAGLHDERGNADVIIVLGAAQYDGRPSLVYQARLDHALSLYREGYAKTLMFTGGQQPRDRFSEAEAGQMYAMAHGVPREAILLESRGRTTMQSLQAARVIMRDHELRNAILVSDPFHAFRLRRMSRDLGMQAMVSPAKNSRVRSFSVQARYIGREVGVYALYRLFGM